MSTYSEKIISVCKNKSRWKFKRELEKTMNTDLSKSILDQDPHSIVSLTGPLVADHLRVFQQTKLFRPVCDHLFIIEKNKKISESIARSANRTKQDNLFCLRENIFLGRWTTYIKHPIVLLDLDTTSTPPLVVPWLREKRNLFLSLMARPSHEIRLTICWRSSSWSRQDTTEELVSIFPSHKISYQYYRIGAPMGIFRILKGK